MTVAMEIGWQSAADVCASSSKNQAWSEDPQKILSLMMGKPVGSNPAPICSSVNPDVVHLEQESPLPSGWEKRLDLKSGSITFVNCSTGHSTIDDPRTSSLCLDLLQNGKQASASSSSPTSTLEEGHLDLELNLGSSSSSSSRALKGKAPEHKRTSSNEEEFSTGIIVTGCKSCLMYVMLSQTNPQCPRCGSYAELDTPLPKKLKAQAK